MTINTTLDSFLYANTVGFTPDYGKITPRPSGSLISREINQNMEKLISIGHSIVITENSETTAIEYNASFVVKTEEATLKLGTAFQGCQVTIVFAENGYIEYTKAEGNTKEKYKKNTIKKITYNGLYWIDTTPLQIPETNLTCDTAAEEEFKIVKIETILQQGKIPNNIELNIDFTNANSFGETTAATPTYPKLKITNAADEELGIYTICDSRGHYAGKGCWNSGDTMTFKIKGTKACITNSDVRETTSDYTIYSDGFKGWQHVVPEVFKGRATSSSVNTHLNVNAQHLGKTYLLIGSAQWDDGNSTASGIYMLRCGYNDNKWEIVKIAESNINSLYKLHISINEYGEILLSSPEGTWHVLIISNRY